MRPYDQRFTALLGAAARVFAERGYDRTTMRDLAAASHMSLAGIYYYVQGKEDLLYHIQERCFSQVLEGAEVALAGIIDPLDRLAAFIRHHVAFFTGHMPEMKVLSHEAAALSGTRLRSINLVKRRYVDRLEGLLRDAVPDQSPVERSAAAYALFGMMNWIYNWYDPTGPLDPERLGDLLTQLFLGGFAEARSTVQGG
jgi:TetR/AcrR family transcriptional regulator, cholesterol catabolism regulator